MPRTYASLFNAFADTSQSAMSERWRGTIKSALKEVTLLHDESHELLQKPKCSVREPDQIVKQAFRYGVAINKSNRIAIRTRIFEIQNGCLA